MFVDLIGNHIEEVHRICSECREEKPLSDFPMDTSYLRSKCHHCSSSNSRRARYLKKHYAAPSNDYSCPICKDTIESMKAKGYVRLGWCLDHDHDSGKFRGYICHLCNTGISNLREDPEVLRRAIEYLSTKHTESIEDLF